MGLRNFFINYEYKKNIIIDNIKLTEQSFNKIINCSINNWLIYICNDNKNKVDKSHLYFTYVLKIIDYDFIKDYYINNNDEIIKKKYKLVVENKEYINNLFLIWKKHINLNRDSSCTYILK